MKNVSSMKYVSAEFANDPYSLNSTAVAIILR